MASKQQSSALVCGSQCEPGQQRDIALPQQIISTVQDLIAQTTVHQPLQIDLITHNTSEELPISVHKGDIVAFRAHPDHNIFYFGIVEHQHDDNIFIVRVKTDSDRYFVASGPLVKLHHEILVATNLMISKGGKGFNYGGPPSFSKVVVYQWFKDPQLSGRFEVGNILKSTTGKYNCQFLILTFFPLKADIKVLLAELPMEPTKDNFIKHVFHAEVSRFLREGWEVKDLDFDCHEDIRSEMMKFMALLEDDKVEEIDNKSEWCKKYKLKAKQLARDKTVETVMGKRTRDKIDTTEWEFDRSNLPKKLPTATMNKDTPEKKMGKSKLQRKTKKLQQRTTKLQQKFKTKVSLPTPPSTPPQSPSEPPSPIPFPNKKQRVSTPLVQYHQFENTNPDATHPSVRTVVPLPTTILKYPEHQAHENIVNRLVGEIEVLRRAKSEQADEMTKIKVRCDDLSNRLSRLEELNDKLQSRYNTLDEKFTIISSRVTQPHLEQMTYSPYHFPPFYQPHYPTTPTQPHHQVLPYSFMSYMSTQQQQQQSQQPLQQPSQQPSQQPLQQPSLQPSQQQSQPSQQPYNMNPPQATQSPQPQQQPYNSHYPQPAHSHSENVQVPTSPIQTASLQTLLASLQTALSQQKP